MPLLHPQPPGAALRAGATSQEIMEAIWVGAEMRAGGAYAHSVLALDVIAREEAGKSQNPEKGIIDAAGSPDGSAH